MLESESLYIDVFEDYLDEQPPVDVKKVSPFVTEDSEGYFDASSRIWYGYNADNVCVWQTECPFRFQLPIIGITCIKINDTWTWSVCYYSERNLYDEDWEILSQD